MAVLVQLQQGPDLAPYLGKFGLKPDLAPMTLTVAAFTSSTNAWRISPPVLAGVTEDVADVADGVRVRLKDQIADHCPKGVRRHADADAPVHLLADGACQGILVSGLVGAEFARE